MRSKFGLQLILITIILIVSGCKDKYELNRDESIYLNTKSGNVSGGNTIKLFDIAVDSTNHKAYVQGILSKHIAVIDTQTNKLDRYINTEIEGYHLAYMATNGTTGNLFIIDQGSNTLIKIDTTNDVRTKDEVSFDTTPSKITVIKSENLVAISFASQDKLRFYSTSSMELVKTLDSSDGIYGPQGMKARNGKLYVALSRDTESRENVENSAVAIVDPSDWSVEHLASEKNGAYEVAVNSSQGRYWLLADKRLRLIDEEGNSAEYTSSGEEFKMILYNKQIDRVLLLTRDGADSSIDAAPYGSIVVLKPDSLEVDYTYRVGMKPSRFAIDSSEGKVFTSNMADGTLSVVNINNSDESNTNIQDNIENKRLLDVDLLNKSLASSKFPSASYSSTSSRQAIEVSDSRLVLDRSIKVSKELDLNRYLEIIEKAKYKHPEESIDIGTSISDIKSHPDGQGFYVANRLGGNQILYYNTNTKSFKAIDVSNWPTSLELDSDKRELYVLSHYASAIDIIDIDSNSIVTTIDMTSAGVAQNRTHFLSDLAYDQSRQCLYATFPEQGLIAEINTSSRSVTQVTNIFTPVSDNEDEGTQVGRAQVEVDDISHKVFVYYRDESTLDVLDPFDNFSVKDTESFSSSDFDGNDFQGTILGISVESRKLYVGPHVFKISGGKLSKVATINHIEKVLGVQDDYLIGVKMDSDKTAHVYGFEVKSDTNYDRVMNDTVATPTSLAPKFAIDLSEESLYVGYTERAKVNLYSLKEK